MMHAVDTGLACARDEHFHAHRLDRVRIAHQNDRRLHVAPAERRDEIEHVVQAHALRQRTFGSALDHRAVGHRIGKRHAELDDVGAGVDERVDDRRP